MMCASRITCAWVILLCVTRTVVGRVVGSIESSFPDDGVCKGEVGEILHQIRALMNDTNTLNTNSIHAYIVPMNDAHQSEYVADHDKRLQYISKFTGSAGEAVITATHAVLWTDSRYYLQAGKQLDSKCWTLMKRGLNDVPTMPQWILSNLPQNSTVGVDPFLITESAFREQAKELKTNDIQMVSILTNLVDVTWRNRPEVKRDLIVPLDIKYSGKEAGLKITEVLDKIKEEAADTIIITTLDDIAWLLNLRGSDIEYNPVFFSYVILSSGNSYFFVDSNKISEESTKQLNAEKVNLTIRDYDQVLNGVNEIINSTLNKVVVSTSVSKAVAALIPEERLLKKNVVATMKAVKNNIEAKNMDNAHIRDGVALIQYLHWLNTTIDEGNVTEISGAAKLEQFRSSQDNFRGLSFEAISAVGEHASIVHYSPTKETSEPITRQKIYLIDSGGQYWDGTTDVTRTIHFGIPKNDEKECYTRVLKGFIAMATSVFPSNTSLKFFDYIARRPLWQAGLDYGHGTGHGVGMFLLVHEYPPLISSKSSEVIAENMFTSNEPGYYRENQFGVRIEDVLQVIKSDIPNAFDGNGGLTFKSITYAPLATNLIMTDMLTKEEANYVNTYNKRVMDTVGPILLKHKFMDTYKWLQHETRQICSWSK